MDYLNSIEYGARTTVDMGLHYELTKWSFWALGKNIFNRKIESVYNSDGRLNSSASEIARNGKYAIFTTPGMANTLKSAFPIIFNSERWVRLMDSGSLACFPWDGKDLALLPENNET